MIRERFSSRALAFVLMFSLVFVYLIPPQEARAQTTPEIIGNMFGNPAIRIPVDNDADAELWVREFAQSYLDSNIKAIHTSILRYNGNLVPTSYMAHLEDDSLWGWGVGHEGGTLNDLSPVKILDSVYSFTTGMSPFTAIKTDGSLWTWGLNSFGQMGNGETSLENLTPFNVMNDVVSVGTGENLVFALKEDGTLWAWGMNDRGQLGVGLNQDGITEEQHSPVMILENVSSFSTANIVGGMALREDGSLWAWGQRTENNNVLFSSPEPVMIAQSFTDAFAGASGRAFMADDGTQWSEYTPWPVIGGAVHSVLAAPRVGQPVSVPMPVPQSVIDEGNVAIAGWVRDFVQSFFNINVRTSGSGAVAEAGDSVRRNVSYFVAQLEDDSLWGWGLDRNGDFGSMSTPSNETPLFIMDSVFSFTFVRGFETILMTDGSLWTSSDYDSGEAGDNTATASLGLNHAMNNVVSVDFTSVSNQRYFLALKSDNTLWAWGSNDGGQIGNGTKTEVTAPVMILDNVVSATNSSIGFLWGGMALREDGSLWAWGQRRSSHNNDAEIILEMPVPVMIVRNFPEEFHSGTNEPFLADDGVEWGRYIPMRRMTSASSTTFTEDGSITIDFGGGVSQGASSGSAADGSRSETAQQSSQRNTALVIALSAVGAVIVGFAGFKLVTSKKKI